MGHEIQGAMGAKVTLASEMFRLGFSLESQLGHLRAWEQGVIGVDSLVDIGRREYKTKVRGKSQKPHP
jgi:hypothetical protein